MIVWKKSRRAACLTVLPLALLALAGCGSSGKEPESVPTQTGQRMQPPPPSMNMAGGPAGGTGTPAIQGRPPMQPGMPGAAPGMPGAPGTTGTPPPPPPGPSGG